MSQPAFNLLGLLLLLSCATDSESHPQEVNIPDRMTLIGDYQLYGGSLSEMRPPDDKDRKLAIKLKGSLAKQLFKQIGPDRKDACSTDPGYRERRRGDLLCKHDEDGYVCFLGLDTNTGKSMMGVIC